jgi:AcrR family transcriptional regulator
MEKFSDRQIQLMLAAEKMFATNGYGETSIREIAKAVGGNSAMIAYYFGSKEELVKAIIEYRIADLVSLFAEGRFIQTDPLEQLFELMFFYIERVFNQRYFYLMLLQLQATGKEQVLVKHFSALRDRNLQLINSLIEKGQQEGTFRPDINKPMINAVITGTINQMVLNIDYYIPLEEFYAVTDAEAIAKLKKSTFETLQKIVLSLIK